MVDFEGDTELTLGLPGGSGRRREREAPSPEAVFSGGHKRGFVETGVDCSDSVDFDLLSSNGKSSVVDHVDNGDHNKLELSTEATSQAPAKKAQVVGWPPVRSFRKKVLADRCHDGTYVKVAADGAPYLRKVDLEAFSSYQELLRALKDMFSFFNTLSRSCDQGNYGKFFQVKGMVEYVPTYEDKEGDLMLVGDVPWKMFTESCKRIRLMKSSEAVGLAPRTEDA